MNGSTAKYDGIPLIGSVEPGWMMAVYSDGYTIQFEYDGGGPSSVKKVLESFEEGGRDFPLLIICDEEDLEDYKDQLRRLNR
jgi:hypothetical protein